MSNPNMYLNNVPTYLDQIHALMYASDRILQEHAEDPKIIAQFGGPNAIQWRTDNNNRLYPCPEGLSGPCDTGHVHIMTADLCASQSQVPWDPTQVTATGPKPLPQCLTGPNGTTATGPNCLFRPYLEWNNGNIACEYDASGNLVKCNNGDADGMCIFGNNYLKQWCEYPITRRDHHVHGATDVPPFTYDASKAECLMTDGYCHWMETNYRGDYKYPNTLPNCEIPKFEKFMEKWVVGKTIFRNIKKGYHDLYTQGVPEELSALCDESYMDETTNVGNDFAGPGIHLYTIKWNRDAKKLDGTRKSSTVGFLSKEIAKKYPDIITVKEKNGKRGKFYTVTKDDCRKDKHLKRLFTTIFSGGWLFKNIYELAKLNKKK